MTFEKFVATRTHVTDIGAAIGIPDMFDAPQAGLVYAESFFIHDPSETSNNQHWVELENGIYTGELSDLEKRLYDFAAEQNPGWQTA